MLPTTNMSNNTILPKVRVFLGYCGLLMLNEQMVMVH